jgi:hypothetical protein
MENHHLQWIYPLKMVIFHRYVSLPEGNPSFSDGHPWLCGTFCCANNSLAERFPLSFWAPWAATEKPVEKGNSLGLHSGLIGFNGNLWWFNGI